MLKKLGMVLLAVSIGALLSSCLVKKKDPADITTTFTSTTNILRPYQSGDIINYRVQVANPDGSQQSGTLQIKWEATGELPDPLSNDTFPVLKETTTLTIDGNDDGLVRYIEQDNTALSATEGSMFLRAFATPTPSVYDWLSPDLPPTSNLQRFEIFRSPLTMAGQIPLDKFYVAGDCSGTSCPTRLALAQSRTFQVTAINQTVDIPGTGIFQNAFKVQYNGTINREGTSSLYDILDVCGSAGNITSHETELFVVPEIGVVKMTNTCTEQGSSPVIYFITLDTTSFSY